MHRGGRRGRRAPLLVERAQEGNLLAERRHAGEVQQAVRRGRPRRREDETGHVQLTASTTCYDVRNRERGQENQTDLPGDVQGDALMRDCRVAADPVDEHKSIAHVLPNPETSNMSEGAGAGTWQALASQPAFSSSSSSSPPPPPPSSSSTILPQHVMKQPYAVDQRRNELLCSLRTFDVSVASVQSVDDDLSQKF
eukprot:746989-Hanusia_phi.AAC.4